MNKFFSSTRVRLIIWNVLVMALATVVIFGVLHYALWRTMLSDIDATLSIARGPRLARLARLGAHENVITDPPRHA